MFFFLGANITLIYKTLYEMNPSESILINLNHFIHMEGVQVVH